MISIALIFAAASLSSPSVVEAERAYAAMAQKDGQWTAFRATAAPRAVLFVPDPVDAASWLQGKKDPPAAVKWQPAAAFVACDGKTAVTTGPWQRPTSVGYFTTIWSRPGTTWHWNVDFGGQLETALPAAPTEVPVRRASCQRSKLGLLPKSDAAKKSADGSSPDRSLEWTWRVEKDGSRHILVYLWNGHSYDVVIDNRLPAS